MSEKQEGDRARQRAVETEQCPQRALEASLCTQMIKACTAASVQLEDDLDPLGPIADRERLDAKTLFGEIRVLFMALNARVQGGMGAQAFPAVLKALDVCSLEGAAVDGTLRVSRDATLAGLDRIIARRQEQIDRVIEDLVGQLGAENISISPHPTAAVLRHHSRERDVLVDARDIISGGP